MRRFLLLAAVLALAACSGSSGSSDAGADAGAPPIDDCNSPADALKNADCQLTLGDGGVQGWIYPAGDHDWWHLHVDDPPPRALLTVTGQMMDGRTGGPARSSPVNLQVLVFQGADASTNLGTATDPRLRGAPSPTTVVSRITQPGDYFVLVQDDPSQEDDPTQGNFDSRNPYALTANLASDPDTNEPNDTPAQATVITLNNNQGQATGALATQGDVDVYAIDVPASEAPPNRWILYMGLDAPAITPDSLIDLSYTITDDSGGADGGADGGALLSSGAAVSPAGEQQASTAILVPHAGRYYVTVQPHLDEPTDPEPQGDPRLVYTVKVELVPDLDTNEPNDTPSQATPVNISSPGPLGSGPQQTLQGRLGFIPDPDWFNVTLQGSQGSNTRLRYQLDIDDSAQNSNRFPPAGNIYPYGAVHEHELTIGVPFPDPTSCMNQCPNADICPPGASCSEAEGNIQGIVSSGCNRPQPECIYSYRIEGQYLDGGVAGVANFQGEIQVPPFSGGKSYDIEVDDQGSSAEDRVYNLQLWWLQETSGDDTNHDEANPNDLSGARVDAYSEDPRQESDVLDAKGYFSYGHGLGVDNGADNQLKRIPTFQSAQDVTDYDAVNDTDYFKIPLPQGSPINGYPDGGYPDGGPQFAPLAWSSAWTLPPPSGDAAGSRAYDLQMTYFFCDPSKNPTCDPGGKWMAIPIAYQSGTIAGWTGAGTPGWDVDTSSGTFVTKASECFCIEPRFVKGGVMYMAVTGVSRASYDDAPYDVYTAFGSYPQSFTDSSGAQKTCPGPQSDGGAQTCKFCEQQFGNDCKTITGLALPRVLP